MPAQLRGRRKPPSSPMMKTGKAENCSQEARDPGTQQQEKEETRKAANSGRYPTSIKRPIRAQELLPAPHSPNLTAPRKPHLLRYTELPSWMQDNPYITSHYRPPSYSFLTSFRSLAYIHNETFNVYSHLLPAILVPFLAYYFYTQILPPPFSFSTLIQKFPRHKTEFTVLGTSTTSSGATNIFHSRLLESQRYAPRGLFSTSLTSGDAIVWLCFFLGIFTCLGTSATFHCISNVSPPVQKWGNQLDYVGIVALIWGSFVPTLWYGFWCEEKLLRIYLGMVGSLLFSFPLLVFTFHIYHVLRYFILLLLQEGKGLQSLSFGIEIWHGTDTMVPIVLSPVVVSVLAGEVCSENSSLDYRWMDM